jgi:hypothetical protein
MRLTGHCLVREAYEGLFKQRIAKHEIDRCVEMHGRMKGHAKQHVLMRIEKLELHSHRHTAATNAIVEHHWDGPDLPLDIRIRTPWR